MMVLGCVSPLLCHDYLPVEVPDILQSVEVGGACGQDEQDQSPHIVPVTFWKLTVYRVHTVTPMGRIEHIRRVCLIHVGALDECG